MTIIGGPALRQAELTHIFVWVVLDQRAKSIDAVAKTSLAGKSIAKCVASSKTPIILGDNLFAYMLKIKSENNSFPVNKKIYYDVSVDGEDLSSLGLINGKKSIVYKGEKLPSFVLPDKHRNILHASCRKPHSGKGNNQQHDQMTRVDGLIGKTLSDIRQRPTMLFLTGDQIYADDVAAPLLASIRDKAVELTGWEEVLPRHNNKSIVPAKLKLNGRDKVLNSRQTGFTSGEKKNHLLSFGEYIAMYLITWGGLDVDLPEYNDIKSTIAVGKVRTGPRKGRVKDYRASRSAYNKELKKVSAFLRTAWRMRRLMANISTYMIFDDHDVTDDWNLSKSNATKFKNVPISRRISSNALAAYWVCQGWGNNPSGFEKKFKSVLQNHLIAKSPNKGGEYDNELGRASWDYIIDAYPVVVVLDTRTKRVFDNNKMSQLVNAKELLRIKGQLNKLEKKYRSDKAKQSIIIVSAAPVYGFTALELMQLKFANKFTAEKIDAESWIGNPVAFSNLYDVFRSVFTEYCLILSGDVHYAFNRIEHMRTNQWGHSVNIIQLTSSSACNEPSGALKLSLKVLGDISKMRVFNRLNSRYLYPRGGKHFINGNCNVGHIKLNGGQPEKYSLYFYDAGKNKQQQWDYSLDKPKYVIW